MQTDMIKNHALIGADLQISKEYHIPLLDIKKLLGVRFIPIGLVEKIRPRKIPELILGNWENLGKNPRIINGAIRRSE